MRVRAFRFFGCVPAALVPDNLKAAVPKVSFTDPDLNPLYEKMAAHYDIALLPARPYKPRDKAIIESNILHLQRYILGRLRDRMFFSFAEIKEAVYDQMVLFNAEPMQLYQVSRQIRFEALDKPFAKPLSMEDFALRVNAFRKPPLSYPMASFFNSPMLIVVISSTISSSLL